MNGRGLAAAALVVTMAASASAKDDAKPAGIEGAQGPVRELSHHVRLELLRGHARWTATRRLISDHAGEARLRIPLPGNTFDGGQAVPVGLAVDGDAGWIRGELFGPSEAFERYARGDGLDPASAVLEMGAGVPELYLSGLEGRRKQRVRYELLVPMEYDAGAFRMTVPALPAGEPIRMTIVTDEGKVTVDGRPRPSGAMVLPKEGTRIALVPAKQPEAAPLSGAISVVPFGDRFLTHVRLEVEPRLSTPPRQARVVILLDASRSVPEWLLARQRDAARAYLSHLPDAEVEVIAYARHAERRFGRFVSAAEARRDLAGWTVPRANGTELAGALRLARELLEDDERPRRIVAFNDGNLPRGLHGHGLRDALPENAPLTHFAVVDRYAMKDRVVVSRTGDEGWKVPAAATGGVAFDLRLGREASPAAMPAALERLVRPLQLDELTSSSASWLEGTAFCTPFQLSEGEGSAQYAMFDSPTPWLRLEALLWQQKVGVTLPVSAEESRIRATLAFGANALPADDETAFHRLAHDVGAVTHATSLQAGHARTAPPGFTRNHGGFGQFGRSTGCGTQVIGRHPGNREEWLENALRVAWYDCGGALHGAMVRLDVAFGEIHAVAKPELSAAAPLEMGACLQEAAWELALGEMFVNDQPKGYAVEVRPIFW